jgi:hypothetical protein
VEPEALTEDGHRFAIRFVLGELPNTSADAAIIIEQDADQLGGRTVSVTGSSQ